jgi:elongation factor Ts
LGAPDKDGIARSWITIPQEKEVTNQTVEMIKQLRVETGAKVMECRKALEQGNHNYDRALAYLHEMAALTARKQAEHDALEGRIETYAHNNGRIGVMVEINAETEFASRSEVFRHFAHEVALQITSASPLYVCDEDIPQEILEEQKRTATEKAQNAGKPEQIIPQIVAGVLDKYRKQSVLLRQAYIRDENITVGQLLSQTIHHIGENIVIQRFVRWEISQDSSPE